MAATPDFTPIPDERWPEALADLKGSFATKLNVYRTMAHHPALLRAWTDLREHVVNHTALGPEKAEVVILRASLRLGADYEWSQHVLRAREAGFSDARIRSIRGDPAAMAVGDALLCRAVDELFADSQLLPETVDALTSEAGREAVLDLIATVGFYSTLGFILNSFRTPLDGDAVAALSEKPFAD